MSTLPPSWMSVPRPAMLVAMVTAPGRPAWATIWPPARDSGRSAPVRDASAIFSFFSHSRSSDFSIETVPTRIGWPRFCFSLIASTIAANLSSWFL
jgi:hypothetical protein